MWSEREEVNFISRLGRNSQKGQLEYAKSPLRGLQFRRRCLIGYLETVKDRIWDREVDWVRLLWLAEQELETTEAALAEMN